MPCDIERAAADRGHRVLFTPPCYSWWQPIELFWAAAKFRVRSQYRNCRRPSSMCEHLSVGTLLEVEWLLRRETFAGRGSQRRRNPTGVQASSRWEWDVSCPGLGARTWTLSWERVRVHRESAVIRNGVSVLFGNNSVVYTCIENHQQMHSFHAGDLLQFQT